MDARVKTIVRVAVWVAGGVVLLLAPGVARTMGEGGHLPLDYYLWTSAIPLAFVAAAFAWALRDSLARWRRALGGAALAALLVTGSTQAQVAEALAISPSTVATYRARACEKLGVALLDEVVPREVGAAVVPSAMDVTSYGALPIMVMALCAGLTLRLLTRVVVTGADALSQALGTLAVLAALVVPWLVLVGYARLRNMRVRPRRPTAGLSIVLLALLAAGMLVGGGRYGLEVRLGSDTLSVNAFAPIAYTGALAALAPHLLWPKTRESMRLDEERCVLYLRGRGTGELQAHVLLKIALGLSTPEVCEALHVAPGTVNAYRAQGYELLGVHTSRQLADLLARDAGHIPSAGKNSPLADDSDTNV